MKKRNLFIVILSFAIVSSMLLSTGVSAYADGRIFPDVPDGAYYSDAVNTLYEVGIFTGDSKGNFNPNKTLSRAELATIVCKIHEVEDEVRAHTTGAPFTDVPDNQWYTGYVFMAAGLGFVSGYSDGRFGPNDPVTYDQAVTIIVRAWGYDWMAYESGLSYPDAYLSTAKELGFLNGISGAYGKPMARKDLAVLVNNMLDTEQFFPE